MPQSERHVRTKEPIRCRALKNCAIRREAVAEMSIAVEIPNSLREYCGDRTSIEVSAATVKHALVELKQFHPALYHCVCNETGAVRPHINLFVNHELVLVRNPTDMVKPLNQGDVLTIWTSVSGG